MFYVYFIKLRFIGGSAYNCVNNSGKAGAQRRLILVIVLTIEPFVCFVVFSRFVFCSSFFFSLSFAGRFSLSTSSSARPAAAGWTSDRNVWRIWGPCGILPGPWRWSRATGSTTKDVTVRFVCHPPDGRGLATLWTLGSCKHASKRGNRQRRAGARNPGICAPLYTHLHPLVEDPLFFFPFTSARGVLPAPRHAARRLHDACLMLV